MKTPKPSLKKKHTYITVLFVLMVLIAIVIYAIVIFNKPKQNNSNNTNTTSNSSSSNTTKTTTTTSEGLPSNSTTTSEKVPTNSDLTININSFTQIAGIVTATASSSDSGTCVFVYKPGDNGKPVTEQVVVANNVCTTSMPESEFAYIGNWILTVTYYNNSQKAETQKNVTIN